MKKLIVLSLLLVSTVGITKASSMYRIDDSSVEALFERAVPVGTNFSSGSIMTPVNGEAVMASKNPWIAVVLDFFLGGIAIHRVYLGGTPILILGYLITVGGIFGLVPLVDLVVLIINNQDISKFVGNNRFFMWG